jgi:GH24 family phage-related lysozyme (muramidase)
MPVYFDQSLAQLKSFEGCVPWMYRDSVGKVTVGVGLMLPDAAAACGLPFQAAGGAAATAAQIEAEFARVEALALGKLPSFYRAAGSLELPEAVIDEKLSAVLTSFETTLRAKLTGYDALPDGVKMALLDMAYNLGPAGLLDGYPKMIHAVETGAWAQAAAECARGGINAARNAWTRQQMMSAVVGTIQAEADAVEKAAGSWLRRVWRVFREADAADREAELLSLARNEWGTRISFRIWLIIWTEFDVGGFHCADESISERSAGVGDGLGRCGAGTVPCRHGAVSGGIREADDGEGAAQWIDTDRVRAA